MTRKHRAPLAIGSLFRWSAAALLLAAGSSCSQPVQDQYRVQIVGPAGVDYLAGARRVVLDVGGKEVASTNITPGAAFSLTGTGIPVTMSSTGSVRVRAHDDAGNIVAIGQSPDIELVLERYQLIVFIQKPGTFGRSRLMETPRSRHLGVSALAVPSTGTQAASISVGLFGMGRVRVTDPMTMAKREQPSETFYIYNPLLHDSQYIGEAPRAGEFRAPRYDVGWAIRTDNGTLLVFGGIGPQMPGGPEVPFAQLDQFRLRRVGFDSFQLTMATPRTVDTKGVARSGAAMAIATQTYAFGGRGEDGTALDTVVLIDPAAEKDAMVLLDKKMAAPRVGHTATSVTVGSQGPEVLVVGGAPAGAPVAELFHPSTGFTVPMGDPGPPRSDHVAVQLPDDGAVLIIGGVGPDGVPLGDIRRYFPNSRRIELAPAMVATPRKGFAAFVVGDDVVVAAGMDAQGAPVATAEVFSVSQNLQPRGVVALHPRGRPAATVLSNNSALLVGGEEMDGSSSAVVEIYQPMLPMR